MMNTKKVKQHSTGDDVMRIMAVLLLFAACVPGTAHAHTRGRGRVAYYKMLEKSLAGRAICVYEANAKPRLTTADQLPELRGRDFHVLVVVGPLAKVKATRGRIIYRLGVCKAINLKQ